MVDDEEKRAQNGSSGLAIRMFDRVSFDQLLRLAALEGLRARPVRRVEQGKHPADLPLVLPGSSHHQRIGLLVDVKPFSEQQGQYAFDVKSRPSAAPLL